MKHGIRAGVVIALLAMGVPASAATIPAGRVLEFAVLRQGSEIGTHRVEFLPDGERMQVKVAIDLAVGIGPIVLYRYVHRATELWVDGRLQSLEAETNDDGRKLAVRAEAANGRIEITGSEGEVIGPPDLMPSSYWDMRLVSQAVLLDLHYGIVQPVKIRRLPAERIMAGGEEVVATPYEIDGEYAGLKAWYTADGAWVKLRFAARGAEIDYVLRPPPSAFLLASP
ncbi:MAG: hypothetical protein HYR63_09375 [Proteobacteria bacterium]|nr:hypothetical protein [Pseudomonadota bacterium]MBI3497523.1 hypothetical protein [Pseudomonadota bacterium]